MNTKAARERMFSMGLWSWLAIVEKEADRLSEGAQNALGLLREDLERLAVPDPFIRCVEADPALAHLREDAPYVVCSGCGRRSWSDDAGSFCEMTQPNGLLCGGIFGPKVQP